MCVLGLQTFVQSSILSDAGLRMEAMPTVQSWNGVLEFIFATRCHENFARPSGKRHSLSHSIDHMSLDMVDHGPSKIPENLFTARLYICLGKTMQSFVRSKTRLTPNLRRVSRTHPIELDWLFEFIRLDISNVIGHVRTTKQLAYMLKVHHNSVEIPDAVVRHSSTTKIECRLIFRIVFLQSLCEPSRDIRCLQYSARM